MNPAMARLSRNERRHLLSAEARARKTCNWPAWERIPLAPGQIGSGWTKDFHTAHRNGVFCVLERDLPDGGRHLMINSLSNTRPTWWEAQRLKNEIAGEGATAVEVYPPQSEVVDAADAYHLWVLPHPFPHSLRPAAPAEESDHAA